MNKVASPCCGSCKHWDYDLQDGGICYKDLQGTPATKHEYLCKGRDYSPFNPIPVTDIPGVKELVEKAYRAGAEEKRAWLHNKIDDAVNDYMKALEDKDD